MIGPTEIIVLSAALLLASLLMLGRYLSFIFFTKPRMQSVDAKVTSSNPGHIRKSIFDGNKYLTYEYEYEGVHYLGHNVSLMHGLFPWGFNPAIKYLENIERHSRLSDDHIKIYVDPRKPSFSLCSMHPDRKSLAQLGIILFSIAFTLYAISHFLSRLKG